MNHKVPPGMNVKRQEYTSLEKELHRGSGKMRGKAGRKIQPFRTVEKGNHLPPAEESGPLRLPRGSPRKNLDIVRHLADTVRSLDDFRDTAFGLEIIRRAGEAGYPAPHSDVNMGTHFTNTT